MASPTSNTDRLIDRLVAEASPVRRLVDPRQRAAIWTAVALACVAAGAAWFGLRADLAHEMTGPHYIARVTLLAATMWLAVVAAMRLSVPGADPSAWSRWWPLGLLGVAIGAVAVQTGLAALSGGSAGAPSYHWRCVIKLPIVGAVPALAVVVLIRRATSLDPVWTTVLGLVAAGAAGSLAAELTCPVRLPMHLMLWHVLPIAGMAAIGGGVVWIVARVRAR